MAKMTDSQLASFLEAPRHAIVATIGGNGAPQQSPVWYIYRDGKLYISTSDTTAKTRNLRRDPSVSVCVDAGRGDSRYVVIRGSVTFIANGTPEQRDLRWQIIRHYYDDEDAARAYHDANEDETQIILVVHPEKIISQDFN